MNEIKAIIFDLDSLMWGSEALYVQAHEQAATEYALAPARFTQASSSASLNTGTGKALAAKLCAEHNAPAPLRSNGVDIRQKAETPCGSDRVPRKAIVQRAVQLYFDMVLEHSADVQPGLIELLDLLDDTLMRRGVVTSFKHELACIKLKSMGLLHRFDKLTCGPKERAGKPVPDVFLQTAENLNVAPEHCVVLEDSLVGLLGARAAGMMPVLIPDLSAPSDEMKSLAEIVLPSINEFYMCFRQAM